MVVEYIRYAIDAGRAEAFEQAYRRAADALEASEHCERYEVTRCAEDATERIVGVEWDSEEDACPASARAPGSVTCSRRSARSCATSRRCATTR
jgi:quinol monooxygenase YgiN